MHGYCHDNVDTKYNQAANMMAVTGGTLVPQYLATYIFMTACKKIFQVSAPRSLHPAKATPTRTAWISGNSTPHDPYHALPTGPTEGTWQFLSIARATQHLSQFSPWLAEHNLNVPRLFQQATSSQIAALAWADVQISGIVVAEFIVADGRRLAVRHCWLPLLRVRHLHQAGLASTDRS